MITRRELLALTSGAAVTAVTAGVVSPTAAQAAGPWGWVATWAAVPTTVPPGNPTVVQNQTVRHVVHCSLAARTVTPVSTLAQDLFLSGVAVRARGSAVVTLGDSITNGANTRNNLNHRWPDLFAARLREAGLDRGVANVGVSGNRLLHDPNPPAGSPAVAFANYFGVSGLRRFDRDVLAQPGREYVIVLLGVNDLGHPGTVAPLSEVVSADDRRAPAAHRPGT